MLELSLWFPCHRFSTFVLTKGLSTVAGVAIFRRGDIWQKRSGSHCGREIYLVSCLTANTMIPPCQ